MTLRKQLKLETSSLFLREMIEKLERHLKYCITKQGPLKQQEQLTTNKKS